LVRKITISDISVFLKDMLAQQFWIRIHSILHPASFNLDPGSGTSFYYQKLKQKITLEKNFISFIELKNLSRSALRISMITLQPSRKHPALQSITFLKLFFYLIRNTVAKSLLVIDVADEAAGGFA
jgi:hypothetical protein